MTQATIKDVITEVKKVKKRLDAVERNLTALMIQLMPEKQLSPEEWEELVTKTLWMRRIQSLKIDIYSLVNTCVKIHSSQLHSK